jgi:hypothetical protein
LLDVQGHFVVDSRKIFLLSWVVEKFRQATDGILARWKPVKFQLEEISKIAKG